MTQAVIYDPVRSLSAGRFQNDYLGWISRARREDTRQKRLSQMLNELRAHDCYMKMAWRPRHWQ